MFWFRLPGDPKIWSTVEAVKPDGTKVKFIIQEIPPNRYEEALDHLCTDFITSEAMCRSLNLIDDKKSVAELRSIWAIILNQGISVDAYEVDKNNLISTLAGLNVLMIQYNNAVKTIAPITSTISKREKLLATVRNCSMEANSSRKRAAGFYLKAAGLVVDPNYRRLGLGTHLLLARDKIAEEI